MWRRTAGVLTLAATAVACLADSHPPDAGDDSLGLADVTVVNGADAPRRDRVNILIRDGRIVSIGPDRLPPGIPEHRVVRGGFVIPGLIDQHAHAAIRPLTGPGRISGRADWILSREALDLLVRFGITTIRNPEAPIPDGTRLRQAVRAWSLIGPDVFTAGPALSSGYTSTSIRTEVGRQAAAAVDWIKLGTGLPPATVRAAIDEAHARGLKVVGHLQRTTWTEAARAGIDAITHGAPWSAEYMPASRREQYSATMLGRLDWLEWVALDGEPYRGDGAGPR